MSNKDKIVFEVRNLTKNFRSVGLYGKTEIIKALNNVSFSVSLGQTMGIVGESGSGKSTIGRCVLGLTELSSGEIIHQGEKIDNMSDFYGCVDEDKTWVIGLSSNGT